MVPPDRPLTRKVLPTGSNPLSNSAVFLGARGYDVLDVSMVKQDGEKLFLSYPIGILHEGNQYSDGSARRWRCDRAGKHNPYSWSLLSPDKTRGLAFLRVLMPQKEWK